MSDIKALAIITFFILIFIGFGFILGGEHGYKRGQIDALSDQKICYELIGRPDGSIIWQRMDPCREEGK